MLWTPGGKGSTRVITNMGIVGNVNPGTAIVSNATTLLDGAVTELITAANNNQDSWGIEILVTNTGASAAASEGTMDILVGGATDDVLIEKLIVGYSYNTVSRRYFFPVHIPAGTRIAATFASVRTSVTARISVWLYGGGVPPFRVGRKITTYGTPINNARGQAVTPTASGGAASVTQMTASTSEDHFYFMPGFQPATDTTITPAGALAIGIGVGAATEQRIGTWWFWKDTAEMVNGPNPGFGAFTEVASGQRLTMLASNSGANDAAYDGLIYAVS